MKLEFVGRVLAVYVPEVKSKRVPLNVVLTGSVWPSNAADHIGVDPAAVMQVNAWRLSYWVSVDDVESVQTMLKNAINARSQLNVRIDHRIIVRDRVSQSDATKMYKSTEWNDTIDYID